MHEWKYMYEMYFDDVYKFLFYLLGNREEAEDLTQDTFIRGFTKRGQFRYQSSEKTWFLAIARNLGIDHIRAKKRLNNFRKILAKDTIDSEPSPDQLLDLSEEKKRLYRCLQLLKTPYREVLTLRGIQDLSVKETSLVLNWPESKVTLTFHRAVKSLREQLGKEEGPENGTE